MVPVKNILRSLVVLAMVLAVGFLGLWFLGGSKINIKNQNVSAVKDSKSAEASDQFSNFGGKTPQETLRLLISALEKNDLALASKYFVPENRETVSEDLSKLNSSNFLGDLITDLKNIKLGKPINKAGFYFEVADRTDQTITKLELLKNQIGFWKIISL